MFLLNTFLSLLERDSGKPKYEHSHPERQEGATTDGYTATPLTAGNSSAHFPVPTLSSTITVIAPSHHGNNTTESWSEFPQDHPPFGRGGPPRKRCRDYDGTEFLTLWSVSHVHDRLAIFMSVTSWFACLYRERLLYARRHVPFWSRKWSSGGGGR